MVMLDERQRVSEFTELSERSKAATAFDWERDYSGAYRQCPTAFWLAPDATDILPEPDLLHPRPMPVSTVEPPVIIDPPEQKVDNRAIGGALSIILAGPVFATTIPLVSGPLATAPMAAAVTLALFPFTVPVGMLLATLPVCVGSLLMAKLGEVDRRWRHPLAWMGVGAPFGMLLAGLFGSGPQGVASMAVTGATCAGIARWKVRWGEPVQPARNALTPAVAISA